MSQCVASSYEPSEQLGSLLYGCIASRSQTSPGSPLDLFVRVRGERREGEGKRKEEGTYGVCAWEGEGSTHKEHSK